MKLGIMQGRLVDSEKKNRIQFFPSKNWNKEIFFMKLVDLKVLEWTINSENISINHFYNKKKNLELTKFLKQTSVTIPSVTCDFFMQKPFFKKLKYRKTISDLKKVIQLSKNVGTKLIVLPLVDNASIKNNDQEKKFIKEIKKISKFLGKDQKIIFEIDYNPNEIMKFMSQFNSKFGINYDTGNSACMGYSFSDEKKYFKFVKNIHIKDRIYKGKSVRLGKGHFNFDEFFSHIKKIKYKGNLIMQTARSKNHIREILINKKFIEKYL